MFFMKKFLSVLLTAVMLLSFVSVNADASVWEEFAEYGKFEGNANIRLDMTVDGEGQLFDTLGISSILGSGFSCDLNMVTNADQTSVQANGKMSIISANEQLMPSGSVNIWMDMNAETPDAFQFIVILKAADGIFTQAYGDKYLLFDYASLPGMADMFNALLKIQNEYSMDLEKIAEEFADRPEIKKMIDAVYELLSEVEPIRTDDGYSLVMSGEQVKNMYVGIFKILSDGIDELNPSGDYGKEINQAFAELSKVFETVHLFDRDRAIVMNLTDDGKVMSGEMNLDFDIYELYAAAMGMSVADNDGSGQCKLSFKMNGVITPLPEDYTIDPPELSEENTVNVLDRAISIGFIPEDNGFEPYNEITIEYNGIPRSFENSPVVRADRTFLPLREMANMFGISNENIFYDDESETVTIFANGTEIVMNIGSCDVFVNGETKTLETPVFTINDRTYIPVRLVSEMFGKDVDYSENNNNLTVTIND